MRALLVIAFLMCAATVRADLLIRIGDADGFGYGAAPGFKAANGGPADANGSGILDNKDYLPDINQGGHVKNKGEDEFDFRSTQELNDTQVFLGPGVSKQSGTTGARYTDMSLNLEYDSRQSANKILVGGNPTSGLVFGHGGAFPGAPSATTADNQPGFVFDFDVLKSFLPDDNTPIFFNLIFADYDVSPASITITLVGGSKITKNLVKSDTASADDGRIQSAFAQLDFDDVFAEIGNTWASTIRVDFQAPSEPYTAFDYVELSTLPIPEPSGWVLLSSALLTGGGFGWRARQARGRRRV